MKTRVKESTMVKPMEETLSGNLWLSNIDLVLSETHHTRCIYLYRCDGGAKTNNDNGRIEINCNGEGVSFVEAECDGTLDELGEFCNPRPDLSLAPTVDYSKGISTFLLFLINVLNRFKCGGATLGFANEHHTSDEISGNNSINTWTAIARGLTTVPHVSLDRRVLAARNPRNPSSPHIEHHPPPPSKTHLLNSGGDTTFSTFRLSRDHINALKQKCNDNSNYTMYEVVAGHVWRCVSIARGLPRDQETKLQLPVDLPQGYFGNGIFYTCAFALIGELVSKPLKFAVEKKVHDAIARMDDEYLRPALDYLELHLQNGEGIVRTQNHVKCPNFGIMSWVRLSVHKAEFGLGKPVFVGAGEALSEGKSFLYPNQASRCTNNVAVRKRKSVT
ncbi:shikimate O-hydroxycinnamoyltransferase-like [Salvia splendens]|uniref:shikimate O-hydroxycinnamoyltransferase-like n=1 Tax=Salvia splendens TaxID=180675 RepID=UPI001C27E6D5|nr:shikimate O-hydroxycinnamoyltransferase-like [Salvia splendens]